MSIDLSFDKNKINISIWGGRCLGQTRYVFGQTGSRYSFPATGPPDPATIFNSPGKPNASSISTPSWRIFEGFLKEFWRGFEGSSAENPPLLKMIVLKAGPVPWNNTLRMSTLPDSVASLSIGSEKTHKQRTRKQNVHGIVLGFWGDFVYVFFLPHQKWPEKNTQTKIWHPPSPGANPPNLFMLMCVFFVLFSQHLGILAPPNTAKQGKHATWQIDPVLPYHMSTLPDSVASLSMGILFATPTPTYAKIWTSICPPNCRICLVLKHLGSYFVQMFVHMFALYVGGGVTSVFLMQTQGTNPYQKCYREWISVRGLNSVRMQQNATERTQKCLFS